MVISKNILVRNKAVKRLKKKDGKEYPIYPLDESDILYKKRLNQNMRNRLQSMLSYDELRIDEVSDFLSLLEERLSIEDMTLERAIEKKEELDDKYGKYNKRYTTMDDIDISTDIGFIEYMVKQRLTTKTRESVGMPLTEQQKEKKWQKKHKKKAKKKLKPFLYYF